MIDRKWMLLAILAIPGCTGFNFADPRPDDPRFLDRVCESGTCETSGSAREASAITTDTVGFEMGPAAGSVTFELRPDGSDATLALLMAGHGAVSVTSPDLGLVQSFQLTDDYWWFDATVTPPTSAPTSAKVSVSVADVGSVVQLADIRATGLDDLGGCAVSAPGDEPRGALGVLLLGLGLALVRRRRRGSRPRPQTSSEG